MLTRAWRFASYSLRLRRKLRAASALQLPPSANQGPAFATWEHRACRRGSTRGQSGTSSSLQWWNCPTSRWAFRRTIHLSPGLAEFRRYDREWELFVPAPAASSVCSISLRVLRRLRPSPTPCFQRSGALLRPQPPTRRTLPRAAAPESQGWLFVVA